MSLVSCNKNFVIQLNGVIYNLTDEINDSTWTQTEINLFSWAVAFQSPVDLFTWNSAIRVAKMWIYRNRGCVYPEQWNDDIDNIEKILGHFRR